MAEQRRSSSTFDQANTTTTPKTMSVRAMEADSRQTESPLPPSGVAEHHPANDAPQMEYVHGIKLALIVLALCFGIALVALAIPTITTQFNSLNDIGWYGSAYFIAVSALQPLVGRLFQLFSPKWCYLACIAIFAVGSLVCALAPSSPVLIVGRAITGIGGAGLLPGSLIITSFIAEPKVQPALNGLLAGTFGLMSIVAPVIGGAFTQHVTWRWCFWINLPLSGVTAILLLFLFKPQLVLPSYSQSLKEKLEQLDWIGFTIFSGGNAMLLLALQWGGNSFAWNSSRIIGLFVGAGVTLATFAGWQWYKGEKAGVPPRIISHPVVLVLALISFLAIGGFQIFIYYLPLFFQTVKEVGATESGVMYLPTVISDFIASLVAGGLITKLGYYNPFFFLGFMLSSIGLGLATTLQQNSSSGFYIGLQILAGVGNGFIVQLAFTAIQSNLPLQDNSVAIASVVYFQFLGGSVFQAIGHQIFQSRLTDELSMRLSSQEVTQVINQGAAAVKEFPPDLKAAAVPSYRIATTNTFYASIVAFGVAFFLSFGLRWKKTGGQAPSKPEAEKEEEDVSES